MKLLYLLVALGSAPLAASAQSVGIGTDAPNPAAALDITAPGKGLLIPRMDSAARAQLTSPPTGLLVFQTDGRQGFWYYGGGAWRYLPDKTRSGDNLGSHTATQSVKLAGNALSNNGTGGLRLDNAGMAAFNTAPAASIPLTVLAPATSTTARTVVAQHANLALGPEFDAITDNGARMAFGINNSGHSDPGAAYFWNYANTAFRLGTNSLERMRILADGRVGIGTSAPAQKLEVAGSVKISGVGSGLQFPDNTIQTTAAAADNLGNHTATQNVNLADKLLVGNGGSKGLSIGSSGNVGIGTSSPGSALHVAGAVSVPYATTGSATTFTLDNTHQTVRRFGACATIYLPAAATCPGRLYTIINSNGTGSVVTLTVTGSGSIYDDVLNATIPGLAPNNRLTIQSDGADWIVVGR